MLLVFYYLFAFAVVLSMTTLGAILALRIWFSSAARSTRIACAAIIGTALPVGLFALSGFSGGAFDTSLMIGLAAAIIGPILMVGWPVAYWATRKLDNLTEFHAKAFE